MEKPPEERFWKYVNKTDTCWIWTGYKNGGYGQFRVHGKTVRAPRYSWFLATGKWSELYILHKCNNPTCVNPAHLYEGDQSDNRRDDWIARRAKQNV